ncbi:TonB family protein [Novosphingobium soli]|uniref:TonB family protein n=1 Tax=Novosphingobium soli TaxID=574956 RepID=UPI00363F8DE5
MLALHLLAVIGLIRAFTPDLPGHAVGSVTRALTFEVEPERPSPSPAPRQASADRASRPAGAAGAPGRKLAVRPDSAPPPAILVPAQTPQDPGTGAEAAGTADRGAGSGTSGTGLGPGAAGAGAGRGGGGGGAPTVKLSGDISSARDYPRATRELRIGASVVIDLQVGVDGRVRGCIIVQPSPDAQADRITCQLATQRFRFRPATNAEGAATESVFRWRQRWFY